MLVGQDMWSCFQEIPIQSKRILEVSKEQVQLRIISNVFLSASLSDLKKMELLLI